MEQTDRETDGSDAVDLATRLRFLGLTAADAQRLQTMHPWFEAWSDGFVEVFYKHLFEFPATARFLHDPALVERLKLAQKAHLASMLAADWNASYVAQRHAVGHVHAEVGIEPEAFLGAYNQYLQFALERLASNGRLSRSELTKYSSSMIKAVLLDVGLTLDAYFLQSTQKTRHALDMLWRANLELRQFAQLASHDLKTPLATVMNLCDEALDEFGDQMPAEARELVTAARMRTYRMSMLIEELLSVAVQSSANSVDEEVSPLAAITDAVDRLRPVLDERGIDVILPEAVPHVLGDRVRLREAFYNLLSNAAKFIDKRPGRITISVEVRAQDCIIAVADNGPGIPRDELERIFVPFRRLPMHRELPGSGLGLYFTKNLIEHQNGRVWATSEPGVGSCFYVKLRRVPD